MFLQGFLRGRHVGWVPAVQSMVLGSHPANSCIRFLMGRDMDGEAVAEREPSCALIHLLKSISMRLVKQPGYIGIFGAQLKAEGGVDSCVKEMALEVQSQTMICFEQHFVLTSAWPFAEEAAIDMAGGITV